MRKILIQHGDVVGWVNVNYIDSVYYQKESPYTYYLYIGTVSGRKYREKYSTEEQCEAGIKKMGNYLERL